YESGGNEMKREAIVALGALLSIPALGSFPNRAHADGDLRKVNHFVFMMQENRSFDNYFGALPYVPGGPYHPCSRPMHRSDHRCVDGLTCTADQSGALTCSNYNLNLAGDKIFAFHDPRICNSSGLDHGWPESHREANWSNSPGRFTSTPNDGFVRQNESD